MNIIIKVPNNVIAHCKNKLKLSDKTISKLYKSYINFVTDSDVHGGDDGFEMWFEENGEETLEELENE